MLGDDYMAWPEVYYKKALQGLAYGLYVDFDKAKANRLFYEDSVEKLEGEIIAQKGKINVKDFIFCAGSVAGHVLECADRDDGNEGFNDCCGGLYQFKKFVDGI